jgi:hypothetical protein
MPDIEVRNSYRNRRSHQKFLQPFKWAEVFDNLSRNANVNQTAAGCVDESRKTI